jgi:hypothetical protein
MSKSKLKLTFLVTGCAGFIGSHLVNYILSSHPQCDVIGLDNLTSGTHSNLVDAQAELSKGSKWKFCLITEDIRNLSACREAVKGVDIIIHLAAKCSVPDSFNSPIETHDVNVGGFSTSSLPPPSQNLSDGWSTRRAPLFTARKMVNFLKMLSCVLGHRTPPLRSSMRFKQMHLQLTPHPLR